MSIVSIDVYGFVIITQHGPFVEDLQLTGLQIFYSLFNFFNASLLRNYVLLITNKSNVLSQLLASSILVKFFVTLVSQIS
jgi:hypothetical protein